MSGRIQATKGRKKDRRLEARCMQSIYDRRGDPKACSQCATRQQIPISQVRLGGCIPRDWQGQGVTGLLTDHVARHRGRRKTTERANEQTEVGVGFRIGLENDQWLAERPWMKEGYD